MSDWIKWKGGECPVDGNVIVEIEVDGAGLYEGLAYLWAWSHDGFIDITRYRVVEAKEETRPANKYQTPIGDVYDVLKAFEVTNPALQHLIKKALKVGNRGHKDIETDLQDIIDSAVRAKEIEGF
jgi:hypothetical protein